MDVSSTEIRLDASVSVKTNMKQREQYIMTGNDTGARTLLYCIDDAIRHDITKWSMHAYLYAL